MRGGVCKGDLLEPRGRRGAWLALALIVTAAVLGAMVLVLALAGRAQAAQPAQPAPAYSVAAPDVVITPEQVKELFAGRAAKMVVLIPSRDASARVNVAVKKTSQAGSIFLVDFAQARLEMVEVVSDALTAFSDPFISPDGTRIVYATRGKELAVCRLQKGGPERTVICKPMAGFDARWWFHPKTGEEYVIYGERVWENSLDISGKTFIQKLRKGTCQPDGAPKVLLENYRMCGGRTPSGRYICATLPGFALAEFVDPLAAENAQVKFLVEGPSGNPAKCNGSMCPDDSKGPLMIWEEKSHQSVCYGSSDEKLKAFPNPRSSGYQGTHTVQLCEWSTDGDYLSAIWASGPRDEVKLPMRPFVFQVSTQKWVQVADAGDATHVWVAPTK